MNNEWEVIKKQYLPNHVSLMSNSASGQYIIWEKNIETGALTTRTDNTDTIYLRDHPELSLAFRVATEALKDIEYVIRMEFEKTNREVDNQLIS